VRFTTYYFSSFALKELHFIDETDVSRPTTGVASDADTSLIRNTGVVAYLSYYTFHSLDKDSATIYAILTAGVTDNYLGVYLGTPVSVKGVTLEHYSSHETAGFVIEAATCTSNIACGSWDVIGNHQSAKPTSSGQKCNYAVDALRDEISITHPTTPTAGSNALQINFPAVKCADWTTTACPAISPAELILDVYVSGVLEITETAVLGETQKSTTVTLVSGTNTVDVKARGASMGQYTGTSTTITV
jgi:hypothetical protein